jgi:hypothetical protein
MDGLRCSFDLEPIQAQMLNGRYGGEGEGIDVTGSVLHQVTKWTFKAGKLVSFEEIISFQNSTGTPLVCDFVPSTPPPYPFSTGAPGNNPVIMIGFGCPQRVD